MNRYIFEIDFRVKENLDETDVQILFFKGLGIKEYEYHNCVFKKVKQ